MSKRINLKRLRNTLVIDPVATANATHLSRRPGLQHSGRMKLETPWFLFLWHLTDYFHPAERLHRTTLKLLKWFVLISRLFLFIDQPIVFKVDKNIRHRARFNQNGVPDIEHVYCTLKEFQVAELSPRPNWLVKSGRSGRCIVRSIRSRMIFCGYSGREVDNWMICTWGP